MAKTSLSKDLPNDLYSTSHEDARLINRHLLRRYPHLDQAIMVQPRNS